MFSKEELSQKTLEELYVLGKEKQLTNLKRLRKSELISILSGETEAPVSAKNGRKPEQKAKAAQESISAEPEKKNVKAKEKKPKLEKSPLKEETKIAQKEGVTEAPKQESKEDTKPAAKPKRSKKIENSTKKQKAVPEQTQESAPAAPIETAVEADPSAEPKAETSQETSTEDSAPKGQREFRNPRYRYDNRGFHQNNNNSYRSNLQRREGFEPRYSNRRSINQTNGEEPRQRRQEAGEEQSASYNEQYGTSNPAVPLMLETENCPSVEGLLEIMPDGYGFLRALKYYSSPKDIYLSINQIRRFGLRTGDYVQGRARPHREGDKFDALMYIDAINGKHPEENTKRVAFEDLIPIFPQERYTLEVGNSPSSLAVRLIDLLAPIGKGQRAMIVSQPKAGKTTLLKQIAAGITANYPESHLIVLLIDERPEEVTDMQRCIQGEVAYSTFDELPEHHTRVAELVQERALRLVEQGKDVVILLDSLTRLARAYNLVIPPTGRTLSGGMDPGALYKPKRFFGSARNIEGGGSLTVIATALVETGSRMDDIVYEEFKGTGNNEIHLDRKLSEKRIFPAIDIYKSGTRREDLLLTKQELEGVYALRKVMAGNDNTDIAEQIIPMLNKTTSNEEFITKMKDWIRIYERHGFNMNQKQDRHGQ